MATISGGRPAAQRWSAAWGSHSLLFYAWFGGGIQVLFLLGAVAFVMFGSRLQQDAIGASSRAQHLQLSNQAVQTNFLDAQASIRGFVLTGQDRFLQSYYAQRALFAANLSAARAQAWPAVVPALARQGRTAQVTFSLDDRAIRFPRGSRPSLALIGRASAASDQFVAVNRRLQAGLGGVAHRYAADSGRSLGLGLAGSAIVLTIALAIPAVLTAVILGWSLPPIIGTTRTVQRLAAGEHGARAVPGGPAELRHLSQAINVLASESGRLRAEQEENARLSAAVREISLRVREHLGAEEVIREAVTGIAECLGCEYVWVGQVSDGSLTLPEGNRDDWGLRRAVIQSIPPNYLEFMDDLYRRRGSYVLQDLRSPEAAVLPAEIQEAMLGVGGVSLLFVPFGIGNALIGELTLVRTDSRRPWTAAEIAAVESLASDVGRGLDHARLYEQEKELVGKLREVDMAKSDFLAAVSHDLRAPLTSIVGFAEMLGEDERHPLTGPQRRMLAAINRNASRLDNLINDVLTMSKIELGTFQTQLRRVDLAAVLRTAAGEFRAAVADHRLDFELSCPDRGLLVDGDEEQLDRALTNLLSNAVKYTPRDGRVRVSARRDGDQALVEVSDTGIGIPSRDQSSLFTRFFRASNVVHTSYPGTGLGLAIVATIVRNHHGEVTLRSREGAGTTVTVRLPLAAGPPPGPAPGRAAPDEGGAP